ncbi:hypothetical protein E4U09_002954 [Claviceps aff. purpurea]|uniref:Uncharacterized protein n=1 Tax=Claviceps aff. purpurea TaxID=1967640 RepID=A0A9P7QH56_9HYPO|nr:hypothetical protein E4U09_002954 [Claviceps aff. purpurea]
MSVDSSFNGASGDSDWDDAPESPSLGGQRFEVEDSTFIDAAKAYYHSAGHTEGKSGRFMGEDRRLKFIETFTDAFIQSRKGALIHARGLNILPQGQVTAKSCALDGQDNGGDRRLGTNDDGLSVTVIFRVFLELFLST